MIEAVTARIKDVDELHASLAREFGVHICAASGPIRVESGRVVTRARLFAPDGSHGAQDKLTLTAAERRDWKLSPGTALRVFETTLGPLGILQGEDCVRPAIAAAMTAAGARILLAPGCTDSPSTHWRTRRAAQARAVETGCPVVQAVTVEDADWLAAAHRSTGAAAIFVPPGGGFPDDGVLATGKLNAPGWVYGTVPSTPEPAEPDPAGAQEAEAPLPEVVIVPLGRAAAAERS